MSKILIEKYRLVYESDEDEKKDILSSLNTLETDYVNASKPAVLLTTYPAGDVNTQDNISIPADVRPVDSQYYQSSSLPPSVFYHIENGEFLWYFTDPMHKKAVLSYYDSTDEYEDLPTHPYEDLFDKLHSFPPYAQWEQDTFQ